MILTGKKRTRHSTIQAHFHEVAAKFHKQWFTNLLGTRDRFQGRQCVHGWGCGGSWFWEDYSSVLHSLCTVFLSLHHLHVRLSGVREGGWGPLL